MVKKDLGFGAPLPHSINCATAWANEGENTSEDTTISDSLSDPNASAKLSPTVRSGTNAPTIEDRGRAPARPGLEKLEDGCECHREESLDEVGAGFLQRGPGEQIRQERLRSWSRDVLTRIWMGASTTERQDVIGHATTPQNEAEIAASPNSSLSEHNYSSFDSSGSTDEESDEDAVDDSRDAQILHCWRRRPAIPLAFLGASHENGHLSETPPRSHASGKDASVALPPCAEPLVPLMPHAKLTTLTTDRPRLIKKKTSFAPSLRSVVEESRAGPRVVSHSAKDETASSASSGQGSKDMCFSLDHSWLLDDTSDFGLCIHLLDRAKLNLVLPR
ncbi:hypothetical protein FA10DRAFT_283529 [Acaromyces ingoldii]|uniref:Uncharacterized protein n=1 Tax=Acaromyces ingoldii TaxID=215250 RepID=A0A316YZ29_9BASI|nr:hypothetical protein FA10DRAFT_283529 [Acaromyces ingoldii]PWN93908.1 hypothetical protein FA10DRAFT_283529 [Acaromyces ingoldii]